MTYLICYKSKFWIDMDEKLRNLAKGTEMSISSVAWGNRISVTTHLCAIIKSKFEEKK